MDNDSLATITLLNPSDDPFEVWYNNKLYRTIPPGQVLTLPYPVGERLALKHLIDRMCNINNIPTNDEAARSRFRQQIVVREDRDASAQTLDEFTGMQRKIDLLNKTNASGTIVSCPVCNTKTYNLPEHEMLNHGAAQVSAPAIESAPATMAVVPPQTQSAYDATAILRRATGDNDEPQTLKEEVVEEVATPVTTTPVPPEAPIEQTKTQPTREELIAFARDTLKMNVEDPDTKKAFEVLSIDALVKELSYGI